MALKLMFVLAFVALCSLAVESQAVEIIEMTDANRSVLPLDLAEALETVQRAYETEFGFTSVKDVRAFLKDCAYVDGAMKTTADDAFKGMAKQIKAIMAEPSIMAACSVQTDTITASGFDVLDSEYQLNQHDYLSPKKTAALVAMKKQIESTPNLHVVMGSFINNRIERLAEASLANAAENVNIFFDDLNEPKGWFDFDYMNFKHTCNINLIKPICKLVRRSSDNAVSAISDDVADFIEIVQSGDQAKLARHEQASGVTMSDLKAKCASMENGAGRFLKPIDQIERWIADGLMSEEQLQIYLVADRDLAFYNELNKLCKLAA